MRIRAEMAFDHAFLKSVSQQVGGAFYVFDEAIFRSNYLRLRERLRAHWPGTDVAYAIKANYMPAIIDLLAAMEGHAEVVSRFEYDVARQALPGKRIILNGPIKREADLRLALAAGSQINLDSFQEIESLKRLSGEFGRLRVGLRVCFPSPHLTSRFGFEVDTGELERALEQLESIDRVELVALHCHATCRSLGVEDPVNRVRQLCDLASGLQAEHPIETLNVGGGLLGEMTTFLKTQFPFPVPTLNAYADAIGEAFVRHRPSAVTRLVVEPGVSMVANAMCLVARVMEVRQRRHGWQALLDTSINSVNPTHSGIRPELHAVTPRVRTSRRRLFRLVGHTCMEHDVICDALTADLEEGDFVVVENRGAYSLNYTPPFIVPAPAVINRQGDVLKRADDARQVLGSYSQTYSDALKDGHNECSFDVCGKA
ncbi:alanine racemase [Billgrantia saliphila]|uniref:alanine racemase n=1 Tax=Billgrantia saliphila TaxID=1848458 RepID=UPI0018CC3B09|nr:alanine racemase [Halomonas saliphila]